MKNTFSLFAATLALAACSPTSQTSDSSDAESASRVVNVYSARHYSSDAVVYAAFTEATGIEINLIEARGDQLIERVRADGERSPADVIVTVDAARLHRAEEAGLFASSDFSEFADRLPSHLIHPEGYWVAVAQRSRVIAYSNERVADGEITTYADLADPRWNDRICVRSSGSVYNQSLLASIVAHEGEEAAEAWAQAIVDNMARAPQGGDRDQLRAIAAGECDVAITNHYYFAMMANSNEPADQAVVDQTTLFFPNQDTTGAHMNVSGAGIAVNAPHPEEAREFIAFLISDDAQRIFAEMTNEVPAVPTASWENETLSAMMPFNQDELAIDELGANNATAQRIFDRVGWQ